MFSVTDRNDCPCHYDTLEGRNDLSMVFTPDQEIVERELLLQWPARDVYLFRREVSL